jgi:hypothetical protein
MSFTFDPNDFEHISKWPDPEEMKELMALTAAWIKKENIRFVEYTSPSRRENPYYKMWKESLI